MIMGFWASAITTSFLVFGTVEIFGFSREALALLVGAAGPYVVRLAANWWNARQQRLKVVTGTHAQTLHDTIDWVIKERKELYLESEERYKALIARQDTEIHRLREEVDRLRKRSD